MASSTNSDTPFGKLVQKIQDFLPRFLLHMSMYNLSAESCDYRGPDKNPNYFKLTDDPDVWYAAQAARIALGMIERPYAVRTALGDPSIIDDGSKDFDVQYSAWSKEIDGLVYLLPFPVLWGYQDGIGEEGFIDDFLKFVDSECKDLVNACTRRRD